LKLSGAKQESRADGRPIALSTNATYHEPMVAVSAVVAQQGGWSVLVVDENIQIPIVVKVSVHDPTALVGLVNGRSPLLIGQSKGSAWLIHEHEFALLILQTHFEVVGLRIQMAVADENVLPSVIVQVGKKGSPFDVQPSRLPMSQRVAFE